MNLSVGIVGLPNAGKSTLFNALASRRLAETAPRPFTTIDPHEAVVAVPDTNLEKLAEILRYKDTKILGEKDKKSPLMESQASLNIQISQYPNIPRLVPTTVRFIDIAGLVKGAHKGEGLGNQFLAKIREVDAIVHVVRAFSDPQVSHSHPSHEPGSEKQIIEDIEIVNLELELGGIEKKPTIVVLNTSENRKTEQVTTSLRSDVVKGMGDVPAIQICAKLEEELIDLEKDERKEYLKASGIKQQALDLLIQRAYKMLDLITFYTIKGGKEISAWSLKRGSNVLEAAEKVHTDFAKNFIKAEVIEVGKLLEIGNWRKAKEEGKIRLEGRDYVVQDRDVVEFKVNK